MGEYVQLGDVRTYYEVDGAGDPLVLLHPGGCDSRTVEAVVPGLAARFRVYRPDRRGHGRTPDVPGPITYELMARDTIAFLETVVGGPAHLVGHSDGAPTALTAAILRPDLVSGLVLAAGVFHHTGWAPGAIDLPPDVVEWFTGYHGDVSPDGPDRFPALYAKLHRMQSEEPTFAEKDLAGYPGPTLVMVGDDEDEIPIEHTLAMRGALPRSQLAVVPGTGHGLISDKPDLCAYLITDFLGSPA
ncbi:alpha/beta hydrolase [Virgisporangium ochraceum]|uniref:Alpha/beta hydrolase n=1 Tax=Virgisporangium ochraceum TaxID=65505 RepID=A0A8J4A7H6_9ACTN|nr:alpha/beta hydrolase [Virgisporangium ochraceum]GIJ74780.1 alpha/beta hydrolase [Virgisporangium ochraceum]